MKTLHQQRWMWTVLLISCLAMVGLTGCEDLFSAFGKDDGKETASYLIAAEEVVTSYSEWPISEGEEPSVDRSSFMFLMLIDFNEGNDNQVRIYGLEGADTGKRDNYLYPGCKNPSECKIFGTLDGEDLTIDLHNNGRSFRAEGAIRNITDSYATNDFIDLSATYTYQHTTIHYQFEGGVMLD